MNETQTKVRTVRGWFVVLTQIEAHARELVGLTRELVGLARQLVEAHAREGVEVREPARVRGRATMYSERGEG